MMFDKKMNRLTSDRQFGFKKGSSTETALHKIIHRIERRIANKGYVLGTFLDIEGAFDNVSFEAISNALEDCPIDSSTAGWIVNMVSNRYVTITHKNVERRVKVTRGCPQGGVLSPFLWNLIVDDLLRFSAKDIPGYLQAFADDLISLCEGDDLSVIRARAQTTINTIERWCATKGLNVSALKTKLVMFTWKRKWSLPQPITVGGLTIEPSGSVKFLGVTLDSKLNFNEHIDNTYRKALATLMQCKRAVGPTWGLTPKTCLWIYNRVVRPTLSYSAVVWVNALNKQYNAKKFVRVQAIALGISTGAMPGTDYEALDHITNTPRIVNYIKGEAAKGASRLQAYKDWTTERHTSCKGSILSHSTINNNYLDSIQLPQGNLDLIKPEIHLQTNYTLEIPDDSDLGAHRGIIADYVAQLAHNTISCYTDGSKTDSGTGYGFVITTDNNQTEIDNDSVKLPDYCTVYQAELAAITAGATSLAECAQRDIIFFTDSLSSIQALNNKTINSRTALECHQTLTALATHNTVKVMWVPGHEGHWGNERADQLAKEGTSRDTISIGYVPQSFIKQKIKTKTTAQDAAEWTIKGHRHSSLTLGNTNQEQRIIKELHKFQNNRLNYRIATQLITGHAGLNDHLFKMKLVDNKTCPDCGSAEETVGHFLGQCPAHSRLRGEIFNTFYASLSDIFQNNSLAKIVKYANNTKRLEYDPDSSEQHSQPPP
jgi:ribonuclease HI